MALPSSNHRSIGVYLLYYNEIYTSVGKKRRGSLQTRFGVVLKFSLTPCANFHILDADNETYIVSIPREWQLYGRNRSYRVFFFKSVYR